MKFLIVVALTALAQDGSAFSLQKGAASRARSSLSMTVEEKEVPKTVNVGVIGCGRIGLVHLEAITKAPGVKPVIVSNPTVSKAEAGKKEWRLDNFECRFSNRAWRLSVCFVLTTNSQMVPIA